MIGQERMISMNVHFNKRLAIYLDDTDGKGTYPLRRALTIAHALPKSIEILFIGPKKFQQALKSYQFIGIKHSRELVKTLQNTMPDLLIRDSGSTSKEEIEKTKKIVPTIIHFDDFGEGGKLADLVIQTLYSEAHEKPLDHYIVGIDSFIADEQLVSYKKTGLSKKSTPPLPHLIVTFGDEDASNLSYRTLRHLSQLQIPLKVTILVGANYQHDITELKMMALSRRNTVIKQETENPTEFLSTADIILCSSGYTPYEVGVMGIPCIVLAQNEFEATLDFPTEKNGFVHLGPGRKVKQSILLNAVMELLLHDSLRKKAIERQIDLNLGEGKEIVCEAILYYLDYPKRDTNKGTGKETSDMI